MACIYGRILAQGKSRSIRTSSMNSKSKQVGISGLQYNSRSKMKFEIAPKLYVLLCAIQLIPTHAATTTSYPPLPSGCHADNVVNAIRNHGADAISYCNLMIPEASKTTLYVHPQYTYTTTITSGISTTSSGFLARMTEVTNVYREQYQDPPKTFTPLTYSNNKPSIWTVVNADPTPSYLTAYDPYRIYSGCKCVVTPTSTSHYYGGSTYVTSYVRPTSTETQRYVSEWISYPPLTYAAACNPYAYVNQGGIFYKTVWANRPVQTISPLPTVRYKQQCCQLCADTFNCLWWRHSISGACTYVWATDTNNQSNGYNKCINGYGGVSTNGTANANQADAFGLGSCATANGDFPGENQSSQESTEYEFQFQNNCAVFGGAYCA